MSSLMRPPRPPPWLDLQPRRLLILELSQVDEHDRRGRVLPREFHEMRPQESMRTN